MMATMVMQSINTRHASAIITYRATPGAASQKYLDGRDGVNAGGVDAGALFWV